MTDEERQRLLEVLSKTLTQKGIELMTEEQMELALQRLKAREEIESKIEEFRIRLRELTARKQNISKKEFDSIVLDLYKQSSNAKWAILAKYNIVGRLAKSIYESSDDLSGDLSELYAP